MACWSSLARDIVVVIGDRLLADGDLDYYMSMRAVCHGWRAATDNPRAEPADSRFRLQQWIMLDEKKYPKRGDPLGRLFLNTATGRFVHRELAALVGFYFITSMGGLLVVASRKAPHAVRVYNPFTDTSIEFMAAVPESVQHTTAYLHQDQAGRLPPTLVMEIGVSRDTAYSAQPDAEHFAVVEHGLLDKGRNIWGIAGGDQRMIDGLMSSVAAVLPDDMYMYCINPCCHFIGSPVAGENLLVVRRQRPARGVDVFKVDAEMMAIRPTSCIGGRALFLGDRCVSVDVNKFPSVDGNCIFYEDGQRDGEAAGIYVYDLTRQEEEWAGSVFVEDPWIVASCDTGIGNSIPPSMTQLLMHYCTNITWSQLDVERRHRQWQEIYMA
jgi:hypothetical protein